MKKVRGVDSLGKSRTQRHIPGDKVSSKKEEMAIAGIKQCRKCGKRKILYKGGYCNDCRKQWLKEYHEKN